MDITPILWVIISITNDKDRAKILNHIESHTKDNKSKWIIKEDGDIVNSSAHCKQLLEILYEDTALRNIVSKMIIEDDEVNEVLKTHVECLICLDKRNNTLGLNILNILIANNPNSWELRAQLMIIHEDEGKLSKALTEFNTIILLNPNLIELRLSGAVIAGRLGHFSQAVYQYKYVLNIQNHNLSALLNYGELISQTPDLITAEKILQSYLDAVPKLVPHHGQLQAMVNLLIISYLNYDLDQCSIRLSKIRQFVGAGYTKIIIGKPNRTFVRAFSRLLQLFLKELSNNSNLKLATTLKSPNSNQSEQVNDKIYHLGDSHCLSFAHQLVNNKNTVRRVIPKIIKGAKAWHFTQKEDNQYKSALELHVQEIPDGSKIWISFGEIDCRRNEGILIFCQKYGKDLYEISKKTAYGYFNWVNKLSEKKNFELSFFGVPAPTIPEGDDEGSYLQNLRLKIIITFNNSLKELCQRNRVKFVDIFSLTAGKNDFNNGLYMIDEYHLAPSTLEKLSQSMPI